MIIFFAHKGGDYSRDGGDFKYFRFCGEGDYSREAINWGTAIIWGNTVCLMWIVCDFVSGVPAN